MGKILFRGMEILAEAILRIVFFFILLFQHLIIGMALMFIIEQLTPVPYNIWWVCTIGVSISVIIFRYFRETNEKQV